MFVRLVWWFIFCCCCCRVHGSDITYPCTTPDGLVGLCISLYSCKPLLKLLGSLNPAAIQFAKKAHCGFSENTVLVCCGSSVPIFNSEYTTFTPLTTKVKQVDNTPTPLTTTIKQIDGTIASTTINPNQDKTSFLDNKKYCGFQHTDDRIYNDTATAIDEFPWLVLLSTVINGTKTSVPTCVGSIINRRYVLTSAVCVNSFNVTSVQIGLYNRNNNVTCMENPAFSECTDPSLDVKIEDKIIHPMFSSLSGASADIALLRLNEDLQFTDFVRPICLPMEWSKRPETGEKLFATGWGSQSYNDELVQIKKRVPQKLVINEECIFGVGDNLLIDDMQICTSQEKEDPNQVCKGDTGGPLMYSHKHQWFIEGVVHGTTTAQDCTGYITSTRITSYIEWLIYNMHP